jgi:hypothetical protein
MTRGKQTHKARKRRHLRRKQHEDGVASPNYKAHKETNLHSNPAPLEQGEPEFHPSSICSPQSRPTVVQAFQKAQFESRNLLLQPRTLHLTKKPLSSNRQSLMFLQRI